MNLKRNVGLFCLFVSASAALAQQTAPSDDKRLQPAPAGGQDQFPAAFIASRAELDDLLVGGGTTDDFEPFFIADGEVVETNVFDLQDTSIVNGQGPGLVHDGAIYFSSEHLFWLGNGFIGSHTRTIASGNSARSIVIAYDVLTQAMGVDVQTLTGSGDTVTVRVFSTTGEQLGTASFTLPGDATPVFVGFRHDAGIGTVEFTSTTLPRSPILNDHTYGFLCLSDGCNGGEQLSAKVRARSCGCQVQAILKHGTTGNSYGFKMPDGQCLGGVANRRGKAKAKQCPSEGGKVLVNSCGLEARVRCP